MMQLTCLVLRNFRNYVDETIPFGRRINLIYGKNGSGKTNLLEALYLLSTGRSFRTVHLANLIRKNCSYFYIEAHFQRDATHQTLSIGFDGNNRKIHYNATSLSHFSQVLGIFPSVLYAPIDSYLIAGAPSERRRFLNIQLAQSDPLYVHHLIRYHKAMKHRNILLKAKDERSLDSWEEIMATSAHYLMQKREALFEHIRPKVKAFAQTLSDQDDLFDLFYSPSISMKHLENIQETFQKQRQKELILGTTLNGPHRDDFLITHYKREAKVYASEGQKRTCIAALKLAEREWLSKEHALLGIDDFGIHLDQRRRELLLKTVSGIGQVFLTVPSMDFVEKISPNQILCVEGGTVTSSNSPDTDAPVKTGAM